MTKMAVVKAGGKQYLVKENDEIVVDKIVGENAQDLTLETLAIFDDAGTSLQLGSPTIEKAAKVQIVEQGKGEKIRIARFKAKVRYRKVTGFRSRLTKVKIISI